MIYKDTIIEHGWLDDEPAVRHGLRKARLIDWSPVIKLFIEIVWRDAGGFRLDVKTAWDVSESTTGIVRNLMYWEKMNRAKPCLH